MPRGFCSWCRAEQECSQALLLYFCLGFPSWKCLCLHRLACRQWVWLLQEHHNYYSTLVWMGCNLCAFMLHGFFAQELSALKPLHWRAGVPSQRERACPGKSGWRQWPLQPELRIKLNASCMHWNTWTYWYLLPRVSHRGVQFPKLGASSGWC